MKDFTHLPWTEVGAFEDFRKALLGARRFSLPNELINITTKSQKAHTIVLILIIILRLLLLIICLSHLHYPPGFRNGTEQRLLTKT